MTGTSAPKRIWRSKLHHRKALPQHAWTSKTSETIKWVCHNLRSFKCYKTNLMLHICCHLYDQLPLIESLVLPPPPLSVHNEDATNISPNCFDFLIYSCCNKLPVRIDTVWVLCRCSKWREKFVVCQKPREKHRLVSESSCSCATQQAGKELLLFRVHHKESLLICLLRQKENTYLHLVSSANTKKNESQHSFMEVRQLSSVSIPVRSTLKTWPGWENWVHPQLVCRWH